MKPTPNNLWAFVVVAALAVMLPLSVIIDDYGSDNDQQVLGIFKRKPKKTTKKKTTAPKTNSIAPAPAPAFTPATPPSIPPHQGEGKKSEGVDISSLEREITVLFRTGQTIGPDHFERLKKELDNKVAAGADAAKIKQLREWLETVNPDQVKSTGSTAPPEQTQNCPDNEKPLLTADITDFSKIQKITAPGSPVNDQDKYKGHSFVWTNHQRVPVYAPVDAILDSVAYQADNESSPYQYALGWKVKVNCNYSFKFDHLDEVVPAIQAVAPPPSIARRSNTASSTEPPKKIAIEFKAGDLVGYTQGTRQAGNWDFGFYNQSKEGPLAPLGAFGLGAHALCWADYYTAEKQVQYRHLLDGPKLVCSF